MHIVSGSVDLHWDLLLLHVHVYNSGQLVLASTHAQMSHGRRKEKMANRTTCCT